MDYKHIHNGTVIDGTGQAPIENGNIVAYEDTIVSVGPLDSTTIPANFNEIERIDAQGGYILPGLIDTHVHLMFEYAGIAQQVSNPFSLRFYQSVQYLRRTLDAGITTVRDAGGADLGIKQAVERGIVAGPRMQLSITMLSPTGGHGDSWYPSGYSFNMPHPGVPDNVCDGVDGARKKVREVLRAGAEVVKICSTGGVLSPTDHPEFTQFSMPELQAIVEEARFRRGTKVMAHAQGAEGIKNAILAGVHSIEHGIFLTDEVIDLMLEHGTFLVPTLIAPVGVVEMGERTGLVPQNLLEKAREVVDIHRRSIAKAHRAGVKIAMGTDAGVIPHGQNLRELTLMYQLGMSPMEVIVATTKTAAECLGWQDSVGTLTAGKYADLIITKVNPLDNLRALENPDNIVFVMKGGQIVKDIRSAPTS